MSSLKRKNNKKQKKKSKVVIPKEHKGTLLHLLDMDYSFSQSEEAIVVVQKPMPSVPPIRHPLDASDKPASTPAPEDEFQCSKATLLEYESLAASALEGVLQPNKPNINLNTINIRDISTSPGADDICWESKLNIA